MTLRVVHSSPVWLPQTQTWIHSQIDCVPRDRIENHVVCEQTTNLDQFPVSHLHDFSKASGLERIWDRALRRIRIRRHLGYLARTARQLKASVLHSHFGDVGWANIGAARAARTKHVVTFYGYDASSLPRDPSWRRRLSNLFLEVDRVLCEGPHMASCIADLGCPAQKIRVQHLGIRLEGIPFRPRRWQPGEKLRVLISGIFTEKKGIPYALEALGHVQKQQDLEITIIGDAHAHPETQREKARILHAIRKYGLGSSVRMLGYQPHAILMHEAYAHHIFMSPSITAQNGATEGGAPVSIIEMAASGMIVISSRHCDIPNVILDRQSGFLADERDAAGLVRCLDEVMSYPSLWGRMVELGRRRIEIEFDARIQGSRLADIYYSTLE